MIYQPSIGTCHGCLPCTSTRIKVKVAQSCLTLCDTRDYTIHGILQARILELKAFPFSRDLPNAGFKPRSPSLQEDSLPTEPPRKPYKPIAIILGWLFFVYNIKFLFINKKNSSWVFKINFKFCFSNTGFHTEMWFVNRWGKDLVSYEIGRLFQHCLLNHPTDL